MSKFALISEIKPSIKETWYDKLFLTFDIDWAHDEIIWDTLEILREFDTPATFFFTHKTKIIDDVVSFGKHEIGIHPNFNQLLISNQKEQCAKDIIFDLMEIVPNAVSVRSHSTTNSSILCKTFRTFNLTHECNFFIPDFSGIELKPWKNWTGMTMVPYFWEDDVACIEKEVTQITKLINSKSLKVFDFHPIHVFLNSADLELYSSLRNMHKNPIELIKYRNHSYGTRDRLIELLKLGAS